jgi:DnaJ-domain-containing protein 1
MALFKRSSSTDDDMVSLADDDHAWWASRDELQRPFVPSDRVPPAAPSTGPGPATSGSFTDRYSTDSLFNWASSTEPDDPTHGGTGLPLDPYRVLGLQPGASLSEVVAAHRTLAKRYHPDQLFDADEAERLAAAQTMSTINGAYHELRTRLMGDPGTQ